MSDKGKKPPETQSTGSSREPRRVLGRGLDALLPVANVAARRADSPYQTVGIERIKTRRDQPRKRFEEGALKELADSLREQGMIQPLIVRPLSGADEGHYEIIAGERRWRASQLAGMTHVQVVIKDVASDTAYELALVENLQRQDLDPIETAYAYKRLVDDHGYTQEDLATRIGKDRSTVANTLRLLTLPDEVIDAVVSQKLTEGHARAILSATERGAIIKLARQAIEGQWSVRQTEQAARRRTERGQKKPAGSDPSPQSEGTEPRKNPNIRDLEARLSAALGMNVAVRAEASSGAGTVEIAYDSLDQLDKLIERLLGA